MTEAQTEVKRSKFLAVLVPIGRFDAMHARLRAEHPKANHIVWAKRWFNEEGQLQEASSDDGEPKGCAGKPVLQVMRGNGLVECGLFVVRYFGGIKLGTGGMARAYGAAAKEAVAQARLSLFEPAVTLKFHLSFEQIARWEYRLQGFGGCRVSKSFDEKGVWMEVEIPEGREKELSAALENERLPFSIVR
ncbi:YigZ family protein [Hydrogenimonas sp. SS33]|uniref:IMPACT family protein n=1 Tax=Hydrogenimonas leucolamina TaxID=2954236 RepID=UPI00336C0C76